MESMMFEMFEALVEADDAPVVICSMQHVIIYMNPAALERYKKRGGAQLIGQSIFDCHNAHSKEVILSVVKELLEHPERKKVYTYTLRRSGEDSDVYIVALRNKSGDMIGYYEKHESRIHEVEVNGTTYAMSAPARKDGQRVGIAKDKFKAPDDIDLNNDEIEQMFCG